jgi:hypothetical protein
MTMIYKVIGRETISSLASSIGITSALITNRVVYAVLQAVSGNVRFTIDTSTPTTSLGLRLLQDASVEVWGQEALDAFRCIDDGGTATLEVVTMGTSV